MTNSWLFLFNSFDFIFSLRDTENQQLKKWVTLEKMGHTCKTGLKLNRKDHN